LGQLDTAALYSGDVGIRYLRADILTRQQQYGQALELYRFIGLAFPTHLTPHFMMGQIYLKLGKTREARREFLRVLAIMPSGHNLKLDQQKIEKQKEIARFFLFRL
jgi:tetratricopeptide (TPR) repeat protein